MYINDWQRMLLRKVNCAILCVLSFQIIQFPHFLIKYLNASEATGVFSREHKIQMNCVVKKARNTQRLIVKMSAWYLY